MIEILALVAITSCDFEFNYCNAVMLEVSSGTYIKEKIWIDENINSKLFYRKSTRYEGLGVTAPVYMIGVGNGIQKH